MYVVWYACRIFGIFHDQNLAIESCKLTWPNVEFDPKEGKYGLVNIEYVDIDFIAHKFKADH